MSSKAAAVVLLLSAACTVPDLEIQERVSIIRQMPDASAAVSDAGNELDAGRSRPRTRDGGPEVRTGQPAAGGSNASRGGGEAGAAAESGEPEAGSGGAAETSETSEEMGAAGQAGSSEPGAAGMGGSAGPTLEPTRSCMQWTSTTVRAGPPEDAIEGGYETIAGVTTRQYVCRIRPAGSTYAIPGKYVDRVGCYVVQRRDGEVMDTSVLDGLIDVLVPAPGCAFSWRTATGDALPEGAIDLGDPGDGRNYACRGNYQNIGASGTQIGTIIPSTDDPPVNQCWFESFASSIQPMDPTQFEVLVLDQ